MGPIRGDYCIHESDEPVHKLKVTCLREVPQGLPWMGSQWRQYINLGNSSIRDESVG